MKNILLSITGSLCLYISSFAQGTVKGKLVDSAAKTPLSLATVTIFKAADTAIITYRLSNTDGEFKIPGIPFNLNCRMVVSFNGYTGYRKEFIVKAEATIIDLGTITMTPSSKTMDEVVILAERPPVVIKKDTIEFNASAFKTLPNALVEDLLKKLPGVQVDGDGNIMVNGKPVNRILVDGKTFFGDDPKMATRNLPANVIDKVQVTDDKEELMRNGDDNINNVGKVVNITLKKGVKKGWFGKLYAGAGSDNLYEAGGIANIYRDTLQLSILGYTNNLNRPGFSYSELMSSGGFNRVRSNSSSNNISVWNNNGGSGVSINGINFGGSQNFGGISTSTGGGFNLNLAPSKKKSFFFQYFNGNIRAPRVSATDINQFSNDTIVNNNTLLTGNMITHGHNFGVGAKLNPDSVTTILINSNFLMGVQDEDRYNTITGNNNKTGPLSNGEVVQNNDASTYIYRHGVYLTHLSKTKKGRRYNLNHNLEINNRYNDYTSTSDIRYFYPAAYDSLYAQLRKERIPRTDANINFNYSEPLTKAFVLRLGGRYEFSKLNNEVSTYNRSTGSDKFDVLNSLLSSDFRRISNRVFLNAGFEYKLKQVTITPGIRFLQQNISNRLVSANATVKQNKTDLLPSFAIVYKQLSINYSKDVILPSFNYINPVTDISNPYFIVKGNPDLLPSERNYVTLNYYYNNAKRLLNAGGYLGAAVTNNDIVMNIMVDNRGVQTTMPLNANKSENYSMNWNVNKQYKYKQNSSFRWNTGNYMNVNKARLFYNGTDSRQTTFNYNHWFGVGQNMNDKFEWNLFYSFGKNFTRYSSNMFKDLEITNQNLGGDFVLRMPKHFIWESQVAYSYNGNIPAGMPKDLLKWSAALNITMLKNEVGVLRFAVNDILNRNNNIYVNANRNTITTTQGNILGRYFLATFTYNVRAAGQTKKKVGGREGLLF